MFARPRLVASLWFALLLFLGSAVFASSASAGVPLQVHVTNVTDTTFVVSWVSAASEVGWVKWGGTTTSVTTIAHDWRDSPTCTATTCKKSFLHYVFVSSSNTLSNPTYFDVVSGTTTDSNSSKHYTVTPGPTSNPKPSDFAFGPVNDGASAYNGEAIVYYSIVDGNSAGSSGASEERSAFMSAGWQNWFVNLAELREAGNLNNSYTYSSGDRLNVYAQTVNASTKKQMNAYLSTDVGAPHFPVGTTITLTDWQGAKQATMTRSASPKWSTISSQSSAVGKSYFKGAKTTAGNATATYTCANCSLFRWYTLNSATTGITQVTIDGNPVLCTNGTARACDGYTTGKQWQFVWSFFLLPGSHTITLTANGTKNSAATGAYTILDALEVW